MRTLLPRFERQSEFVGCFLALAIGLSSAPLVAAPPQEGMNNVWHRNDASDIVIVFVHGFNSDSAGCWQHQDGPYWPDLLGEDQNFEGADVFLGGFFTSPFSRDYDIIEASKELYDALERPIDEATPVLERPYIFFVAHSTGGIVARHMLYHNSTAFKDKVVGLALFASPSYGSSHAERFKGLFEIFGTELGLQLRPDSPFLRQLDSDFRRLIDQNRIPNLIGMEFVETHFILQSLFGRMIGGSFGKLIVPRESAVGYFDYRQVPDTDHFEIVKPSGRNHPSHVHLSDVYSSFLNEIRRVQEENKVALARFDQQLGIIEQSLKAGHYETASVQIRDAQRLCEGMHDGSCRGHVQLLAGELERLRSNYHKAHSLYRDAEEIFTETEDWRNLGEVKIKLAEIARSNINLDLAMGELGEAASLFERAFDESGVARVSVVKGDLLMAGGEVTRAEEAYEDALGVFVDRPDGTFEARSRSGLARIKLARGETHEARSLLETAAFDCQRSEDWACRGNVLLFKAELYFTVGEHERALSTLLGARAIFSHMDRPYDLAISYMIEGEGIAAREPEKAVEAIREGARLFREAHRADFAEKAEARIEMIATTSK